MSAATMDTPGRVQWHLWVVGGAGLLWNAFGCVDYVMSHTRGAEWLRQMNMTEPQIAYFQAMPAWMTAVWAIGVWGGVLGAALLLFRRRWALPVFVISLAAYALSLVYSYLLSNGAEVFGTQMLGMNLFILALCIFLAWYAWAMTKRGVLR